MKYLILLVALFVTSLAHADTALVTIIGKEVKLTWDPVTKNTDGTNVTLGGYKIYYGTTSRVYTGVRDVANMTLYKMSFANYGPEYFAVKCYNNVGVLSEFSNEVGALLSAPSSPQTPTNLVSMPP